MIPETSYLYVYRFFIGKFLGDPDMSIIYLYVSVLSCPQKFVN